MLQIRITTFFLFLMSVGIGILCIGQRAYGEDGVRDVVQGLIQPEISEITEILQQGGESLALFSNQQLRVGESGIIMRDLGSYKIIVASAVITKREGDRVVAKIQPFKQLSQPYLPTPNMIAQVGDSVIFRSFNNKAFLIAPNEQSYREIVAQYPFVDFVSSDLLMGFLNSQGKHDPTDKTLPQACNEYGVGLVFIVGSAQVGIFGCQNLAQITKFPYQPSSMEAKSPFYTRTNFEGGGSLTYSLSSKKSKDYFPYYDSFLKD